MFVDKHLIGQLAENLVEERLLGDNWLILHRNWRVKWGEIDLIVRNPQDILVFIEVKALSRPGALAPEDHLTHRKRTKVRRLAHMFVNKHPQLVHSAGWRVDAITVILTNNIKDCIINHYENI